MQELFYNPYATYNAYTYPYQMHVIQPVPLTGVLAPSVLSLQELGTSDLVNSIIGQSTLTSTSAKAEADRMAAKTALDAKTMGDLTKKLSVERTMESRRNGGFLL